MNTKVATPNTWRLVVYSAIGIVVFFLPVTFAGKSTIPLDHMVTLVRKAGDNVIGWVIFALMLFGTVRAITSGKWRTSPVQAVFAAANVVGTIVAFLLLIGKLPAVLQEADLVPFLWSKIVIPVGLIVPIGSMFLALLVSFGLLEFVGVLMQPVMRPIWRTPGRSAVDAVASFVGSYSLGLLITDRVYREGRYTAREAAIIATGFSTVSAAFMIIVAKTLDIMNIWNLYFFTTIIITFAVTAITVRIPPLTLIADDYYPGAQPQPEEQVTGNRLRAAWDEANKALAAAPPLLKAVRDNFVDGVKMAAAITPTILSLGLGGLLLAKYTPVFDWLGFVLYPFAWLVRLPEPMLASKASALGIAEMLLPATQVADQESLVLRFVIGVVAVSAIIFFSGLVPCIMATTIPLKIWHLVVIWFERVALTIVITTPVAYLLL